MMVRTVGGTEVQLPQTERRTSEQARPFLALSVYGGLALGALAASIALWGWLSVAPVPVSVTVKLPPARAAIPSPGFRLTS